MITAVNILLFAYNVQFIVLPAYSELKDKSNSRFAMASIMSFSIDATVYIWLSLAAIFLFGPHLKEDMLDNMVQLGGVISPVLRILFSLILVLDIPFMFFATKEQSLVLHDEFVNRSISRHCDKKARLAAQRF